MSIYKNGVWTNTGITNYWMNFVTTPIVIQEPDGSFWLQIFHHNNPTENGRFVSTDTFATGVYKDINKWFNVNICNQFNKWELLLKQKLTSGGTEEKYRWIQSQNPMLATFNDTMAANTTFITTTGYLTPGSSYGGLWRQNSSNSYLVANNNNSSNWFGAVGAIAAYNNGIPGYNGKTITSGYMDVYIRIESDSLIANSGAKIKNTQELVFNDFIEI